MISEDNTMLEAPASIWTLKLGLESTWMGRSQVQTSIIILKIHQGDGNLYKKEETGWQNPLAKL